jgi:hypothetical protein
MEMSKNTDKVRIIALQKALKIARDAMQSTIHSGRIGRLEDALDEMERLDINTKPSGLQGLCGHGKNVC